MAVANTKQQTYWYSTGRLQDRGDTVYHVGDRRSSIPISGSERSDAETSDSERTDTSDIGLAKITAEMRSRVDINFPDSVSSSPKKKNVWNYSISDYASVSKYTVHTDHHSVFQCVQSTMSVHPNYKKV